MDFEWLPSAMMNINLYENDTSSVYDWSQQDCYNWAISESQKLGLPTDHNSLECFLNYSGKELANFTLTDFVQKLDKIYGEMFYQRFQELRHYQDLNNNASSHVTDDCSALLPDIGLVDYCFDNYLDEAHHGMTPVRANTPEEDNLTLKDLDEEVYTNLQPVSSIPGLYGEDGSVGAELDAYLSGSPFPSSSSSPCPISSSPFSSSSSSSSPPLYSYPLTDSNSPLGAPSPYGLEEEGACGLLAKSEEDWLSYQLNDATTPTPTPSDLYTPTPSRSRRRNTHTVHTESRGKRSGPLEPLHTESRKRCRGPKNWEYIMRLLASKEYNPSLIQWVDQVEWTFKFNKPAEIAKMWGQRSNRPNLSYDNFARGLRYHYNKGGLEPVSERQLVYKCGVKAVDFLKKLMAGN